MSNFEKNRKMAVRILCIILAALMVLGVAASAIFIIIDLIIDASRGHSHLFVDETFKTVLANADHFVRGII